MRDCEYAAPFQKFSTLAAFNSITQPYCSLSRVEIRCAFPIAFARETGLDCRSLSLRFPYLALSYLTLLSFVSASPHSTYKAASTAIIFRTTAFQNILLFPSRLHIILDLDAAAPLAFSHVPISETRFQGI